ncbi:MAG TPA: hypothetical protein VE291_06785 [Terracidiphilus sp.]|nr:hypothetical protein [Terracidiphilus sp.]
MTLISATDANLATLLSKAQRGPIMIRRNHRDVAVMLSATEYRRLHDKGAAAPPTHAAIDPKLAALLDACD